MLQAGEVPRLTGLQRRIRLDTLANTLPGDVFYPVKLPWEVWMRGFDQVHSQGYDFAQIGDEVRYRLEDIGDGSAGQTVVVLHNIRDSVTDFVTDLPQRAG